MAFKQYLKFKEDLVDNSLTFKPHLDFKKNDLEWISRLIEGNLFAFMVLLFSCLIFFTIKNIRYD